MKKFAKKFILSLFVAASFSHAISLGGFELSPEIGAGVQKVNRAGGGSTYDWSVFARLWVGVDNFLIAPQYKYTSMSYTDAANRDYSFNNSQLGVSLGYKIDLVVLSATPYVGANYSTFSEYYDDTAAFNAGLRATLAIIPFSVGVEYEYQKPKFMGEAQKMDSVRFSLGLSF